jgi:tetratricopeptide (TPR) repeat protein
MKSTATIARLAVAAILGTSLAIAPVSGVSLSGLGVSQAMAQSSDEKTAKKRKTRRARTVGQTVGRKLGTVATMMEEKDYVGAMAELNKLLDRKINSYERGMVHYYRGYVFSDQGDYKGAIGAYTALLSLEDLPTNFEDQIRFLLAQLNFAEGHYRLSLRLLDEWMKYQETPSIQAYKIKGQAHYALEEYTKALVPLETAIRRTEEAGQTVRENMWGLVKSIYREMGDLKKVREILEILILNYPPKASYWLELAYVYGELEMEAKELAAIEIAYIQGFLVKENHLIGLAQRYMNAEAPIKASWVIGKGLDDGQIEEEEKTFDVYSQSLVQAREYRDAEAPLKKAAKLSDDGELFLRLGSVYSERDNWSGAISALRKALQKGVKRPDQGRMQLGRAYYNAERLKDARAEFRKARKDKRSRKDAARWIKFLDSEIERIRRLKEAMN